MNKQEVIQQLQILFNLAEELYKIAENYRNLTRAEIEIAQAKLIQLKKILEQEYKRTKTSKNISDIEETIYRPAIHGAWANSFISGLRSNSVPDYQWINRLDNVMLEIRYYLQPLNAAS